MWLARQASSVVVIAVTLLVCLESWPTANAWGVRSLSSNVPRSDDCRKSFRHRLEQRFLSNNNDNDASTTVSSNKPPPSILVISPPGGVGEVAAVKAASLGSFVQWFVVSAPSSSSSSSSASSSSKVRLSQETLNMIAKAQGKLELAGAEASGLLLSDDSSARQGLVTWCKTTTDGMICTLEGAVSDQQGLSNNSDQEYETRKTWTDAIKLAAKQVSNSIQGRKVAIVSLDDDDESTEEKEKKPDVSKLFGSLLGGGGNQVAVPATLEEAMMTNSNDDIMILRHGSLVGIPESSPNFSPLVGGLRRDPSLCEEYTLRSVRLDPTDTLFATTTAISSSNPSLKIRSSRHAVGEAAALVAMGLVPTARLGDVCLSSLRGKDAVTMDVWQEEFGRVASILSAAASSSSSSNVAAPLFTASFTTKNVDRLADWLATKWAPAVLRTFDIAAIRVGARPVYATKVSNNNNNNNNNADDSSSSSTATVEIVWQDLKGLQTIVTAKMILKVSSTGLIVTREHYYDDNNNIITDLNRKASNRKRQQALPGEAVFIRQLAEAVAQAMDKGLAEKPRISVPKQPVVEPAAPPAVTSVIASGTVTAVAATAGGAVPTNESATVPESGPRTSGARRSRARQRGSTAAAASSSDATPPPTTTTSTSS